MRIALFTTCVSDTLFPGAGIATVELLERLGHQVSFPRAQTCCGQMHLNSGYREALPLDIARRFVDVFGDAEIDAVVAPSGSCVAMVRDQYPRLAARAGDRRLASGGRARSRRASSSCRSSSSTSSASRTSAPTIPHRVTYHPSCHSLRLLRVGDAPLRLLRAVRSLTLIELDDAQRVLRLRRHVRGQERGRLDRDARRQGARDPEHRGRGLHGVDCSCLMHIGGGLPRQRAGVTGGPPGRDPGERRRPA